MNGAEVVALAKRITFDLQSVGIAGVVFLADEAGGVYRHLDVYVDGAQIGRVSSLADYEAQVMAAAARVAHA